VSFMDYTNSSAGMFRKLGKPLFLSGWVRLQCRTGVPV
jgi:hypothetical protein